MTPEKPGRFFCLPLKTRKNTETGEHSEDSEDEDTQEIHEEDVSTNHLEIGNQFLDSFDVINSFVDGCFIPPWYHVVEYEPETDYEYLNQVVDVESLWQDPAGVMELNSRQKTRFFCWARYFNICHNLKFFNSVPTSDRIMQGYVGDCSTVSGLSSLSEYERLMKRPVLTDKIKLIDLKLTIENLRSLGYPEEYIIYLKGYKVAIGVKIHFNGCPRCILVDDWIPVKKDKTPLCAHSKETSELWVTLFEKANVRLCGTTYSIKGTNPGVDIYHLTGWIPEIIKLPPYKYKIPNEEGPKGLRERFSFPRDEPGINIPNMDKWDLIWRTIVYNFNKKLVMCLGTNELFDSAKDQNYIEGISMSSGIVSGHAYSVLKVKELQSGGETYRLLLLKNPWGKVRSNLEVKAIMIDSKDNNEDDGIFWIEWLDVLKWFSHLYLSWNKEGFRFSDKVNFKWDKSSHFLDSLVPEDSYLSLFNPQISVVAANRGKLQDIQAEGRNEFANESIFKGDLHNYPLPLPRGIKEERYSVLFIMLIQNKNMLSQKMKYLATHLFEGNSRVITPNNPIVNAVYNNSEIILTKILVLNKGEDERHKEEAIRRFGKLYVVENGSELINLVLLVCCFLKKVQRQTTYTIYTYSNSPVQLKRIPYSIGHFNNRKYDYQWTEYDSGKNPNDIWSYFTNPHFRLDVTQDTNAIILLETDSEISVNMRLFPGRLATVKALRTKKAKSSSEYKLHCCAIQGHLKRGTYTIIPSNFKGAQANFRFNIFYENEDPRNMTLYPIPYPLINLTNLSENDIVQTEKNGNEMQTVGKEFKIDGTDSGVSAGKGTQGGDTFEGYLKRYYLLDRYHVLVTKMMDNVFDFTVKEETLASIKIKVNSVSDSKFVLFSEDCTYSPVFLNEEVSSGIPNRDHLVSQEGNRMEDFNEEEETTKVSCNEDKRTFCSNLSCVNCGGPSGRFYPTSAEMFENERNLGFKFCLFSDLNGGLSKNGRNPSNSAHVLFTNEGLVTFTLVDLLPGVRYRLVSLTQFRFQTLTLISTRPISPVD